MILALQIAGEFGFEIKIKLMEIQIQYGGGIDDCKCVNISVLLLCKR